VIQRTLKRCVKLERNSANRIETKHRRKPVQHPSLEEDPIEYCLYIENCFFGLATSDGRRLSYLQAQRNDIQTQFSIANEKAEKKTARMFSSAVSPVVRTPQGLSYTRATGFTPEAEGKFFRSFEKINSSLARLFNCDETRITVFEHRHSKILGLKGKRQISGLQAAQRERPITVVTC
jgi:hypothetical protein